MTGGFNTQVRGIEIDVTQTLNKFLNQNKKIYTMYEFENYLNKIGLNNFYADNTGQTTPIDDGFVVSFDFDEYDKTAYGILATGLREYQNWVIQTWSNQDIQKQAEFNDIGKLNKNKEVHLRNLWKNKLILKDNFAIYSVGCEWSNKFFIKSKQQNDYNYRNKYIKYKPEYLVLKPYY